jgi:D-lactate dehydrogenase
MEWGKDAFQLMKRIKNIFDPDYLLNPGVILNIDPLVHLKNLKPIPVAHEKIDTCIECGFCEPNCVSAELTLTPRQRIVAYREIANLRNTGKEPHMLAQLLKSYRYAGNETCATDGLCATACPVKIDTGKLIKSIRTEEIGNGQKSGIWVADRMRQVTRLMSIGLSFVAFLHTIFGTKLMTALTRSARLLSFNKIPLWNPWMPTGAKNIHLNPTIPKSDESKSEFKVLYFPSCINRSMGPSRYEKEGQLTDVMLKLLHKGGYEVIYCEDYTNLCCGMAFASKGYTDAGAKKSKELELALLKASENGKYPILCDMSPCLYSMRENMGSRMKLYEPVEFILEHLLPRLELKPIDEPIAIFPVCSLKKMGLEDKLTELAKLCTSEVIVAQTNCCGFAGDRGFSFPELNQHGLRTLNEQLPKSVLRGYSNSRTCEIGLSLHSGIPFQSIVYLVDKVSTSKLKVLL